MAGRFRKRNQGRAVNGVFLLDKPTGISSNAALQQVKRIFGAAKAGHTGSLDPLATGMLPICFGEATKFSRFMLEADKSYRTTARLGVKTASGDVDSDVLETRPVDGITEQMIATALEQFRGQIEQVPSMYSALKHKGQPLYLLARKGIEVERKARTVNIYELELLKVAGDCIEIELSCSKGTYVRSLVDDLGDALGCGAHVTALHRTRVGSFNGDVMMSLEKLEAMAAQFEDSSERHEQLDALLLPVSSVIEGLPEVEVSGLLVHFLKQGQPVFVPNTCVEGQVQLFNKEATLEQRFLGIGEVLDDGRIAPRRLINTG